MINKCKDLHKGRTFASLPVWSIRVESIHDSCQSSQEWTSKHIHLKVRPVTGLSTINVKVHDDSIRKKTNSFRRVSRTNALLSKKKMAAMLKFKKLHLNKPQNIWKNVLWTDENNVETFGHNTQQPNTAHQYKHFHINCQALCLRCDDMQPEETSSLQS